MHGPITTEEIERQKLWWVKRAQNRAQCTEKFRSDKLQLNLQPNDEGILECRGRIVVEYPIYLPDDDPFTAKLVHLTHIVTRHARNRLHPQQFPLTFLVITVKCLEHRISAL